MNYSDYNRVISLFDEQVKIKPDNVALVFEGRGLSYYELNLMSNKLANYLRDNGVCSKMAVGIYLQRNENLIITILAILKAGGICVPLDLGYPPNRISFMVINSDLKFIITNENKMLATINKDVKFLAWSEFSSLLKKYPDITPDYNNQEESFIYTLYTSGSTGQPKGVLMGDGPFYNLINWQIKSSKEILAPEAKTLQFSPISFDVSFQEIFSTLGSGGCLVMISEETRRDPMALLEYININRVNRLFLPYVALQQLSLVKTKNNIPVSLQEIISAGEQLKITPSILSLIESVPGIRLQNQYGPTESHVISYYTLEGLPSSWPEIPPIGKPIPNARVYILNDGLHEVEGSEGELYLGGPCIAKGYVNNDSQTYERFIVYPETGETVYKTGDLGRVLPDGNILYLGRADSQIKIRGFRIEPGEIETALNSIPGIHDSAVVPRVMNSENILCAMIVVDGSSGLSDHEIKDTLSGSLPAYMLPDKIIRLKELPLTPSGKIDRRTLSVMELVDKKEAADIIKPENAIQQKLLDLWVKEFDTDKISIQDHFLGQGGHSIMAFRLVIHIRNIFRKQISLKQFFENDTIAALSVLIQNNSLPEIEDRKPEIEPAAKDFVAPIQKNLWLVDKIYPELCLYNIILRVSIQGYIREDLLQHAINAVIERHDSLRSGYIENEDGTLNLIIHEKAGIHLNSFLNMGLKDVNMEHVLEKIIQQQSAYPFDLSNDLLIRAVLVPMSENRYELILTVHHIVFDGNSIELFFNELVEIYQSLLADLSPKLPELPTKYSDFAININHCISQEKEAHILHYWQEKITRTNTALNLPIDKERPDLQTFNGDVVEFVFPHLLYTSLLELCRQQNVTLYSIICSAFQCLLFKYSNQDDFFIGTTISNRNKYAFDNIIGNFIDNGLIHAEFSAKDTFLDIIKKTAQGTFEAMEEYYLPLFDLFQGLNFDRHHGRSPIIQALFAYQPQTPEIYSIDSATFHVKILNNKTSKYEILLSVNETENSLSCFFEYNSDLFFRSTVAKYQDDLIELCSEIVKNPKAEILKVLDHYRNSKNDKSVLSIIEPNNDYLSYNGRTIHGWFEEQVLKTPDKIAIEFEDQQITFQELNEKANRLAHYLIQKGAVADQLIGFFLERSIDMMVVILGILKSGSAYLPLDPIFPLERLDYMVENANVEIIVSTRNLIHLLPKFVKNIICIKEISSELSHYSKGNPEADVNAENLIYTFYTSGSTGKPKGVEISHSNVSNVLEYFSTTLNVSEKDIILASTPVYFDISVLEIFLPLVNGCKIRLVSKETSVNGGAISQLLDSEVTIMQTSPFSWRMILESGWKGNDKIRLISGGEALSKDLAELLFLCGAELWNLYGPTETTIWSTAKKIEDPKNGITIGFPIQNTSVYILDEDLMPVQIGKMGELYIGGAGLARGYVNRPDLTNERFINWQGGKRIYKTGDLARMDSHGEITYYGRTDHQIKIRGLRIELLEIENAILQHPLVWKAAVVAKETDGGDKTLIAFASLNKEIGLDDSGEIIASIKLQARLLLPHYMVPSQFIVLDTLPLNPNGKLDRGALEAKEIVELKAHKKIIEPSGPEEKMLLEIWKDIFKEINISTDNNFFELGGNSITAVRLLARISKETKRKLPVHLAFEYPTIQKFAAYLRLNTANDPNSNIVAINKTGSKPILFCFPAGRGNYSEYKTLSSYLGPDQQMYYVIPIGSNAISEPFTDITQMASYYIREILKIQNEGPFYFAGTCFGGYVVFEIAQQLKKSGKEVGLLILLDSYVPGSAYAIPGKSFFRRKSEIFKHQIELMAGMDVKTRMDHLLKRFRKGLIVKIKRPVMKKVYKISGRQLPAAMVDFNLANNLALANYTFKPLDVAIAVLKAPSNSDQWIFWDPNMGWDKYAEKGLRIYDVPGDHIKMLKEPYIAETALVIESILSGYFNKLTEEHMSREFENKLN